MSYLDSDSDNEPHDVWNALFHDNKNAFLDFVRVDPSSNQPFPDDVMGLITASDCLECAKAVLQRETGHIIDLCAPVGITEAPPLHLAAECHNISMMELFLSHGAPVNLRCTTDNQLYDGMLPINYALLSIGRRKKYRLCSWTTKQSVFNLIIRMCLPEVRKALETVQLLASKTVNLGEEIFYYAREGKVVQLAALLLVAHDKVLSPTLLHQKYGDDFVGKTTLRQFVTAEITLLEATRITLEHSQKYEMLRTCKETLVNMMHVLQLLEIFEKAGSQLAAYLVLEPTEENFSRELLNKKVAKEVAHLLTQAGFTLKDEDLDVVEYQELLLKPCHEGSMQTMKHPFGESRYLDDDVAVLIFLKNRKERKFAGLDLPCVMQEGSVQHLQQGSHVVQKKRGKKQGSNVVQETRRKKQGSNGNSQKQPGKDSETNLSPPVARPYKQWRFASTKHLCRSHGFCVQMFEQLQILDDVLNSNCEGGQSKGNNDLLQLSTAIERLCHHQYFQDWSIRKSIFKLLYILCLPELNEGLERIRLSARKIDRIEALGCYYAKEGKIIELATLLFVAQEKLIPLTESSSTNVMVSDESMQIRKCLMSGIQRLIDMEVGLMGSSQCDELVQKCEDEKLVFLSELLLLEVFERAGGAFEIYLRSSQCAKRQGRKEEVVLQVATLLEELGFILTEKDMFADDLDCFLYKPGPKELDNLDIKIGSLISPKLLNVSRAKRIGVAYGQHRDHTLPFPCISTHAYNPVQSFQTVPKSRASSIWLSLPLQNQVHGIPVKYDLPLLNFPFSGRWMSFALAIKRGMKRI